MKKQKRIYSIYLKDENKVMYFTCLTNLFKELKDKTGVGFWTVARLDLTTEYENEKIILKKEFIN